MTYRSQLFQGSWLALVSPEGFTSEEIRIGLPDQSVCTAYKFMEKLGWTKISFSKCIIVFLIFEVLIFPSKLVMKGSSYIHIYKTQCGASDERDLDVPSSYLRRI